MRKLFILLLFSHLFITAQNFDLASISSGEHILFTAVFDQNQKLYGYLSLYDLGKISNKEKTFEFIVLDKNLNKVLINKVNYPVEITYLKPYINIDGNLILVPEADFYASKDFVFPKSSKLDLKTNTLEAYKFYCYEDNTFIECPENKSYREKRKELKKAKREKEFIEDSDVWRLKNNHFLVTTIEDHFKFTKNHEVKYFDQSKKELWSFEYNKNGSKKYQEFMSLMHYNEKKLYAVLITKKDDDYTNYLMIFDIKTGEILKKEQVEAFDKSTADRYNNSRSIYHSNENFVFLFNYLYDSKGYINGYILSKINKATNEITHHKISFSENLKKYIPKINKTGYVENGYYLNLKDVFFMENGSVNILTEKFKPEGQYNRMKTTDLVFISTNPDFQIDLVKTLEKEKSKNQYTDYMFSQEINDKKDVVFFYKDYQKNDETKDKNWILFINTLIEGTFNQEKVVISSKNEKYITLPYIAKEGYILMREYNEKDKYNQIRLERLNY